MTEPSNDIPKRASYKPAEVCEIARIQPYVLRSWESEFPRLGVVRGGHRVYRQVDLEQVLKIKHLVFDEGLTLGGARRRLEEENEPQPELPLEELVTPELKERIGRVRTGLRDLMSMLGHGGDGASGSTNTGAEGDRVLEPRAAGRAETISTDNRSGARVDEPGTTTKVADPRKALVKPRAKASRPRAQAARKSKGERRTRGA